MRLDTELPPEPGSIGRARDAVVDSFAGQLTPGTLDEVALLVSELVTNSVRHAGASPERAIGLRADLVSGCIRVEVADWGRDFDPRVQHSADDVGGWGLYLVDSLSDRWGLLCTEPKVVWFELSDQHDRSRIAPTRADDVGAMPSGPIANDP